ncbi:gamma-aminobutyric acid type B receptor subunit 2-like [Hydractinia symbiolongicarpus]|uniref:gamma-aminobutyric acid type B receptor subunit 2-like n=1 Tax=Hydractinia symbiolongicarpus TaxID=13093 RepID=UPI00254A89D7|nr:gamma-aminobutyric acid type B receptor subunit 2-like [Hydractinia symbiolongicarpus]
MFGYKGLLLLFGLFLAWETRHVKVAVLNDSKMIGMSIYNVSVVATIGAIGAIGLYQTSHFETGFILVTIAICLSTTVTLMLIFLPKIRILYSGSTHARKRATSSIVLHSTKLDMRRTNSNTSVSHINEDSFFGHSKSSSIYNPSRPSI